MIVNNSLEQNNEKIESLCEILRQEINTVINRDYLDLNLNREETIKREEQQRKLKLATRNASLGDSGDREYLKEYIKKLLQVGIRISEENIDEYINFNNPGMMTGQDKFEYLYVLFQRKYLTGVFYRMVRQFNWDRGKLDQDGRIYFAIEDADVSRAYYDNVIKGNYNDKLDVLVQRCYQKMYGHDCADILIMDSSVDGVSGGVGGVTRYEYDYLKELYGDTSTHYSRNYDTLYCVVHGRLIRLRFLSFQNENNLERVVKNIYRYNCRTTLSQKNPILHGTFKNGARIVVSRPPVSDGWTFYVRKFSSLDAKKIETIVTHKNSERVIEFLKLITQGELNYVISGPMGSGKTTLLKALVGFMNPQYTIRVAESSFELNLNNVYPERNIHVMQERGNISIYDILTATKKMDTDIMIVGEVNEPKLAGAYVQVAQSGSRMAVTTLHHETTSKLIEYMRNALISEFGIGDSKVAEKQVTNILNFDVHTMKDMEGRFFIERITEIIPEQVRGYPCSLQEGTLEFYNRITDRLSYQLNDIFVFDSKKQEYIYKNTISDYTANLLMRKIPMNKISEFWDGETK